MYNNVVINAVFYLSLKTNADDSARESGIKSSYVTLSFFGSSLISDSTEEITVAGCNCYVLISIGLVVGPPILGSGQAGVTGEILQNNMIT